MRNLALLFSVLAISAYSFANGVAIVDAANGKYFKLIKSEISINVNNQIATVVCRNYFKNDLGFASPCKLGFPIPDNASATSLKWKAGMYWEKAKFEASPQDTSLPSQVKDSTDNDLKEFLGNNPIYFRPYNMIAEDSILIAEITYVQLLEYSFGKVYFHFQNDYTLIQSISIESQSIEFNLLATRNIDNIAMDSHSGVNIINNGTSAYLLYNASNKVADTNYEISYELTPDDIGFYSFSNYLSDTLTQCDTLGKGFFGFIVEPDPSDNTETINKDFVLIIDKSGSMGGGKIDQAKNAAKFIISNLNPDDRFNIVVFDSYIDLFKTSLTQIDASTETQAYNYINSISAGGGTHIYDAFTSAIPLFSSSEESAAKIVVFLTDGQGYKSNDEVVSHVLQLADTYSPNMNLFSFGIGASTNEELLTRLANNHNGKAQFLAEQDFDLVLDEFYLSIQNPVLLNTSMSFSPGIAYETYPNPLPNLYKGQQLIVLGRYTFHDSVEVTFNGTAFGQNATYKYKFDLTKQFDNEKLFLPKIWAKNKMDYLVNQYYLKGSDSDEAEKIRDEVSDMSICYNVMSPFTSFAAGFPSPFWTMGIEVDEFGSSVDHLVTAYPNPFSQGVTFQLDLTNWEEIIIEIYDLQGRLLVRVSQFIENGIVVWDGTNNEGLELDRGMYFYKLTFNNSIVQGRLTKL
ncbi:MAG: VWA domain-containing protein [Bacteroidia bacterium]|nr:VWA domain-containing protein [Bacteroidia bacterium]